MQALEVCDKIYDNCKILYKGCNPSSDTADLAATF